MIDYDPPMTTVNMRTRNIILYMHILCLLVEQEFQPTDVLIGRAAEKRKHKHSLTTPVTTEDTLHTANSAHTNTFSTHHPL